MPAMPDLSIYSASELAELRTAVKDERLRRLKGEALESGSQNGQSYSLARMSDSELSRMESALAAATGKRTIQRRRIDFSRGGGY